MPEPKKPKKIDPKELERICRDLSGGDSFWCHEGDNDEELDDIFGPKIHFKTREEWLDYWADLQADYYRLDKKRVRTVYHRCDEIGWLVPNPPGMTGFDFAMKYLDGEKALELFEKTEDLKDLRYRVFIFRHITRNMFEPYCSLSEMAKLMRKFIAYQKNHQKKLVEIGFPNGIFQVSSTSFDKNMWWFEWYLGRLYYLKAPVNTQSIYFPSDKPDAFYRENPQLWKGEETEYFSIWARDAVQVVEKELKREIVTSKPPFHLLLHLCKIEDDKFVNCDGEIVSERCSYKDAPYFDFVDKEMGTRLELLREKLFDIRLEIILRLQKALRSESLVNLWDDCISIMGMLSFDEIQFLLKADRLFINKANSADTSHPYNTLCDTNRNAGLSDIIQVIGYVKKELTVGTVHKTKILLDKALQGQNFESFYQIAGTKYQKKVDNALEIFQALREEEMEFFIKYQNRVNAELDKNRKNQYRYEALVREIGASVSSFAKSHERLPDYDPHRLVPSIFEKGTDDNVFRKLGDKWIIRFNGTLVGLFDNTIGMHHIAMLLSKPNDTIHASDLINLYYRYDSYEDAKHEEKEKIGLDSDYRDDVVEFENLDSGSTTLYGGTIPHDQVYDDEYIKSIKRSLKDIESDISNAEFEKKNSKLTELNRQRDFLIFELKKARSIFGISRESTSTSEKDRKSVSKAVHEVLEKIEEKNPSLSKFFNDYLELGTQCMYKSPDRISWTL